MDRRRKTLLADTAGGIAAGLWAFAAEGRGHGPGEVAVLVVQVVAAERVRQSDDV